jgi:hypothetical protein
MIRPAWRYLKGTHATVSGLFDSFAVVREFRGEVEDDVESGDSTAQETRGRLTADQENMLRAAVVFTSSGLDACCKRLLRDTLSALIDGHVEASKCFTAWIARGLHNKVPGDMKRAILSIDPRTELIKLYVEERVGSSLQSTDDLKRVRDALGIDESQLPDSEIDSLKTFFTDRNAIVHDLDYEDTTGTGTGRHRRRMEDVREQCNMVLALIATIISETARNLRALS